MTEDKENHNISKLKRHRPESKKECKQVGKISAEFRLLTLQLLIWILIIIRLLSFLKGINNWSIHLV